MRNSVRPFLLGLLLTVLAASAVWAGSGSIIALPPNLTAKPKNRLTVRIDTRWVDANGYRPVRIDAANWPPGPTTADRSFRVVLRPRSWMWGYSAQAVTSYLEMSQGTPAAQATISVPQNSAWNALQVQVYEDGVLLEDLSETVGMVMRNNNQWSEATPAILIIDADAPSLDDRARWVVQGRYGGTGDSKPARHFPNLTHLVTSFPDAGNMGGPALAPMPGAVSPGATGPSGAPLAPLDNLTTLRQVQDCAGLELLPPSELPARWIDYTCFDLVFITLADLRGLVQQEAERWRAIREWAASGATLVVYDLDLDSPQLAELEQLLQLPPADGKDGGASEFPGWRKPEPGNAKVFLPGLQPPDVPVSRSRKKAPEPTIESDTSQKPDRVPFLVRPLGLGRVAAVRTDEPFRPGRYEMGWLFNELDDKNWSWYQRHGVSLHRQNKDFWNLMIPGVGRAPVTSYLILISLFALTIGPVNYYLLKRKQRLYLLLVTVPAGAAVVTFALMNYALISDGLGVRVRARSFTALDQRQGAAVTWSRQCYYAGLAPSRGLQFPTDAAVYPIVQEPGDRAAMSQQERRHLIWSDTQHLASGYLSSRTSSQFLVVHPHATDQGLAIQQPPGGAQPPEVTNRLGGKIAFVVLCDAQGRLFSAEDVPAGERFRPQPAQAATVNQLLRTALSDARPAFPPGYDIRYYGRRFGFRRYYAWSNTDQNMPAPTLESSLLERSLNQAAQTPVESLPPQSYIVILDRAPEALLGYPAAREEASFHVVSGRW